MGTYFKNIQMDSAIHVYAEPWNGAGGTMAPIYVVPSNKYALISVLKCVNNPSASSGREASISLDNNVPLLNGPTGVGGGSAQLIQSIYLGPGEVLWGMQPFSGGSQVNKYWIYGVLFSNGQ